jgi:hypothetical protein
MPKLGPDLTASMRQIHSLYLVALYGLLSLLLTLFRGPDGRKKREGAEDRGI